MGTLSLVFNGWRFLIMHDGTLGYPTRGTFWTVQVRPPRDATAYRRATFIVPVDSYLLGNPYTEEGLLSDLGPWWRRGQFERRQRRQQGRLDRRSVRRNRPYRRAHRVAWDVIRAITRYDVAPEDNRLVLRLLAQLREPDDYAVLLNVASAAVALARWPNTAYSDDDMQVYENVAKVIDDAERRLSERTVP